MKTANYQKKNCQKLKSNMKKLNDKDKQAIQVLLLIAAGMYFLIGIINYFINSHNI